MPWACAKSTLGKRKGIGGHSEATPGGTVGSKSFREKCGGSCRTAPLRSRLGFWRLPAQPLAQFPAEHVGQVIEQRLAHLARGAAWVADNAVGRHRVHAIDEDAI